MRAGRPHGSGQPRLGQSQGVFVLSIIGRTRSQPSRQSSEASERQTAEDEVREVGPISRVIPLLDAGREASGGARLGSAPCLRR